MKKVVLGLVLTCLGGGVHLHGMDIITKEERERMREQVELWKQKF